MKDGTNGREENSDKLHLDSINYKKEILEEEFLSSVKEYKEKLRLQHESQPSIEESLILKTQNIDHPIQLGQQSQRSQPNQQFWKMLIFIVKKHKQSSFYIKRPFFQIVRKQLLSILNWKSYQPQQQQKSTQHQHITKHVQQTHPFLAITYPSQPLPQTLPSLPQITRSLRIQLVNWINMIENISNLELLIDVYTYLNIRQSMTKGKLLDQYVLFVIERKWEELTEKYKVNWRESGDLEEGRQQQEQMTIFIKTQQQSHTRIFNRLYLIHKFQINSFLAHLKGKLYQSRNPNRLLNCFSRMVATRFDFHQDYIKIYLHVLHTITEKKKRFLIANILHSKCFLCSTERFRSGSIHEVRIYQKLMRKFNNFLYNDIPSF